MIQLSPAERRVLRHLCRAGRTGAWVAVRARCVLLAAQGVGTRAIARAVGRAPHWVRRWRERFARDRLNGLVDTSRAGRPARFPPEERHDILSMACRPRAELWGAHTHWAIRPLACAAVQWGFVRSISKSTVHQWLKDADLKPHRVRRWLHSPDPDFRAKVRRVVRLYLHPPRGARVICVDEKTQLQILERVHPTGPVQPGRPARIEQTYRRHGVLAVLAGLDVRSGWVSIVVRRRRRHQEFLELLIRLRRRWPKGRLLVVVDNLSIHTHPRVAEWLRSQQGRVQLVFLPLHASWLNQIELWFSVLERQCLKRASLRTPAEMAARITQFARHWNRTARPFRWTFKGYPLRR